MIGFPKLVVLILLIAAVWYSLRRSGAPRRAAPRRYPPARPQQAIEAEDLLACRLCGVYVSAGAPKCGKPGCPL